MFVVSYLLAIAAGAAMMWIWMGRPEGTATPPQSGGAMPADGGSAAPPATSTGALATRIAALSDALETELRIAQRPTDFATQPAFNELRRAFADPDVPLQAVLEHALHSGLHISGPALAALAERPERTSAIQSLLLESESLAGWTLHFTMKLLTAGDDRLPAGVLLPNIRDWWSDDTTTLSIWRQYFDDLAALGDPAKAGPYLDGSPPEKMAAVRDFLRRLRHPFATELLADVERTRATSIDRDFLQTLGRFWSDTKIAGLVEPPAWTDVLDELERKHGTSGVPRPILVSGETRVGKSSLLRLLAARYEAQGWTVFEASGADLMAGQQWFGQLEARIQRCLDELSTSKKIIWYVPDILQIALSGTHQGQAASILDQIMPAITSGRLVVWTEATPSATTRLLRLKPALRSAFEVLRLDPLEPDDAQDLARAFADELKRQTGVTFAPGSIDAATASARQFLGASNLPGSLIDLMRMSVARTAKEPGAQIGTGDIVATLAQLTGLPGSIIDGQERVDLAAVREYFSSRVIGQDEAVDAIVSRIAMLKAGLTDPGKPIGVFLFAGPTGTGKTELAKTLAEFLFGTAERMIRLDMSEFQTPESTIKILGSGDGGASDSLISLIRKQPFSVILLDEFEKAHPNVWDLFLQVFDDGRLTDQSGQVADFRYAIIILTSNLGATSHRGSRLGFAPGESIYTPDQVLQVIGQTFRPEFQNRLDKVIVFRPLSRDLMRGILKKELAAVLDRRGFKDREWAVEWEASALEFLLEKGFTPEMGARPLKRAIDQYLIAPLAATIVEKRFPEGDQFVFVRSDGHGIVAEFVDPDSDGKTDPVPAPRASDDAPALNEMILAPQGTDAEFAALDEEGMRLSGILASPEWNELKRELSARMSGSDFWSHPTRFETLARYALMDRVKAAAETAEALKSRLDKGVAKTGKSSRELIARLALQLRLVGDGVRDAMEAAPVELMLAVEPAFERPGDRPGERPGERDASLAWCRTLIDMYRGWCRNRNMQISETAPDPSTGLPRLVIAGFGAVRTLALEKGLHVLERAEDDGQTARAAARVRLVTAPLLDVAPNRVRAAMEAAMQTAERSTTVVRRYRGAPSPLVRDLVSGWRSGRLDTVLEGNFDVMAEG
jgi:ATP-dependent Clp protease ATP-binding subunit ClpC